MGNFTLQHKPKPFWIILLSYRLAFLIILAILAIIILLILVALRTRIQVKGLFKIYAIHVYNCLAFPKRYIYTISFEIGSSWYRAYIETDVYRFMVSKHERPNTETTSFAISKVRLAPFFFLRSPLSWSKRDQNQWVRTSAPSSSRSCPSSYTFLSLPSSPESLCTSRHGKNHSRPFSCSDE